MTEILEKVTSEPIEKGASFLDNILSKETFETLDQNAHTLDQIGMLMGKANALLSNPVVGQVMSMAMQLKQQATVAGIKSQTATPLLAQLPQASICSRVI